MTDSLNTFTEQLILELSDAGRHSTARSYRSAVRKLCAFLGTNDLPFSEITEPMLKRFEDHLFSVGRKDNTVSLYFRMLRSVCNRAEERGLYTFPKGLFNNVFTGTDTSEKRAVLPSIIRKVRDADLSNQPALEMSRDLFLLSFYLRGMPFVDLVHLRPSDFKNGIIRYRRSKTGRPLVVSVEEVAEEIFHKYIPHAHGSPYLLPVLTEEGKTGYRQYQSALRLYNIHLGKLSHLLGLKVPLTSYVARHSWATAAYHDGIPVSVISESLGHSSEKVTYNYLESFDYQSLGKANRQVLSLVNKSVIPTDTAGIFPADPVYDIYDTAMKEIYEKSDSYSDELCSPP